MQLKDFPLSVTIAVCVTGAALVGNAFAGQKERGAGPVDLGELRAADEKRFATADTNGDGLVSAEEFANVDPRHMIGDMRIRGDWGRENAGRAVARTELRGVDREDWRRRIVERQAAQEKRRAEAKTREFETADSDGDGQLSTEEYGDMPARLKATRQRETFARLDANEDGMLTPEEFPRMAARLEALDADDDGQVTRTEMRAARGR